MMDTLQSIQQLMEKKFDLQPEEVTPDRSLASLGMDSLALIEFMFDIEDAFGIKLPGVGEAEDPQTVQDAVDMVDKLVGEQHA
jgi:acyl carrier protein